MITLGVTMAAGAIVKVGEARTAGATRAADVSRAERTAGVITTAMWVGLPYLPQLGKFPRVSVLVAVGDLAGVTAKESSIKPVRAQVSAEESESSGVLLRPAL